MIREYKTIREISGPLMVVDHVQGVTYDELGEIVLLRRQHVRRCQVLEVNGDNARWCSCLKSSAGINLAESRRCASWATRSSWACRGDMLGRVFNGMGQAHRRRPGDPGRGAPGHQRPCA